MAHYVIVPSVNLLDSVGKACCVIAYIIGLHSCLCAAAHYPRRSPVGFGWLALGGNCFLSIFRHVALNPLLEKAIGSKDRAFLISQSVQLPALICVLVGALSIRWGVYRLGLGFRLRWQECGTVAAVAEMIVWGFRNPLSLSRSGQGGLAILQAVSLGL